MSFMPFAIFKVFGDSRCRQQVEAVIKRQIHNPASRRLAEKLGKKLDLDPQRISSAMERSLVNITGLEAAETSTYLSSWLLAQQLNRGLTAGDFWPHFTDWQNLEMNMGSVSIEGYDLFIWVTPDGEAKIYASGGKIEIEPVPAAAVPAGAISPMKQELQKLQTALEALRSSKVAEERRAAVCALGQSFSDRQVEAYLYSELLRERSTARLEAIFADHFNPLARLLQNEFTETFAAARLPENYNLKITRLWPDQPENEIRKFTIEHKTLSLKIVLPGTVMLVLEIINGGFYNAARQPNPVLRFLNLLRDSDFISRLVKQNEVATMYFVPGILTSATWKPETRELSMSIKAVDFQAHREDLGSFIEGLKAAAIIRSKK